ncbi:MAG TPA: tripartite tricarboxylate transporter substrate-binding protein, partial [Bradyrhizobium sp.]|nr:tripartite tricarboxylate transporter substrate-binding protein [Bradyrhizobium sp.]
NSPLSADPFIHKNLSYDPIKDFVPITRVGSFTLMLVVNAKLPIHSVKQLVEYAKVHPGELSFASGNTAGIVGGHTLAKWGEMSMLHVPSRRGALALLRVRDRGFPDALARLEIVGEDPAVLGAAEKHAVQIRRAAIDALGRGRSVILMRAPVLAACRRID